MEEPGGTAELAARDVAAMPLLPITSDATMSLIAGMSVHDKDVFICSYPKSGTTWTQNIVFQLITRGRVPLSHISDFSPFLEADRTWSAAGSPVAAAGALLEGWRVFNTHMRWEQMPTSRRGGGKCVYLARGPQDVAVSYFHHIRAMSIEDGGFGR